MFSLSPTSLRHPTETIPLPEDEPFMYHYNVILFISVRTDLFLGALVDTALRKSTTNGRFNTIVDASTNPGNVS